jgi:hypothetical protein
MEHHRLWFIRRDQQVQGPFPEALVCQYIILGRISHDDQLSMDELSWRHLHELPEMVEAVRLVTDRSDDVAMDDLEWLEERASAALRWLDDRKSPDPRGKVGPAAMAEDENRRSAGDRRLMPETVDSHIYRENRALFEAWNRMREQHYGREAAIVVLIAFLLLGAALFLPPVRPIAVGLQIHSAECGQPAARGVNWSGCNKEGELLVGVDLRGAELFGAHLKGARLRYADLTRANLERADLTGADLTGARLGEAVWVDGRVCAADSIGMCK